jgi:hypothetical protein
MLALSLATVISEKITDFKQAHTEETYVRLVAHIHLKWVCFPANFMHLSSALSDNNIVPVTIW